MATLQLLRSINAVMENETSPTMMVPMEKSFEHMSCERMSETDSMLHRLWNNEYDTVIENVSDGIVLVDLVDRIRVLNQNASKLLGFHGAFDASSEMTLGELTRSSKIDLEELVNRVKLTKKGHLKETLFLNKRTVVCEVEIKMLYLDRNIPIGTMCLLRDVSKQWNEAHEKAEFLSIVAHELFNPLTPMKEGLGLILEESIGVLNPVQKQCIGVVYEEVNRLSRLVNDLLDINRLDAGKIRIQRSAIDIHPLIKSVIASNEKRAAEKNITIFENIPHPIFDLYADQDRMKQVLINLLDNAVKYSPTSSSVEIGAISKTGSIEITVTDRGFGISKSDIKKLFQRFAQLNYPEHIENREKGSGLGLSIVKEIIKLHHGKIKVQSEYGRGSRFTITLPKRKKARHHENS
ncbi:cell wall metabolism sensor histidine kinase WalK [bacterium]|nr:MAG: cell wall metabolism sensor histidine kinase WalK [bacterium]